MSEDTSDIQKALKRFTDPDSDFQKAKKENDSHRMKTILTEHDPYPDRIFVRGNLTAHEKLMFAEADIKELKIENGALKSEIDHLQAEVQRLKITHPLTKQELKSIRRDERVEELSRCIKTKNQTIKKLREDVSRLINEIFTLKNKNEQEEYTS